MRGVWLRGVLVAVCGVWLSGCVSLSEHKRVQAANRTLQAEKEALHQELFDERSVTDNLRTRISSLEREGMTSSELLANLRSENDLLDEFRRSAQGTLEDMQKRQSLANLGVPFLPPALDTELKRFADAYPSEVVYDAAHGTVKWKGDLLFPLGSAEVKPGSLDALRSFAEVLKSPAAVDFEAVIVGHTDNKPVQRPETRQKHPTNWHLSAHRAIAVGDVLQKYGYQSDRVGIMGCSEFRPVAENSSEAGQSNNRRVEIYLVPRGSIVSHKITTASAVRPDAAGEVLATP